jgi:hypothetical protein
MSSSSDVGMGSVETGGIWSCQQPFMGRRAAAAPWCSERQQHLLANRIMIGCTRLRNIGLAKSHCFGRDNVGGLSIRRRPSAFWVTSSAASRSEARRAAHLVPAVCYGLGVVERYGVIKVHAPVFTSEVASHAARAVKSDHAYSASALRGSRPVLQQAVQGDAPASRVRTLT